MDPTLLEGVYTPNLVASPFVVNKAYPELIYYSPSSPRLSKILHKWDDWCWDAPDQRQNLAWVLVELLPYHFVSSVCWIETQDLFFGQYNFEHFIKVGLSPTLVGMAIHILKAIYYRFEDEPEAISEPDAPAEDANPASASRMSQFALSISLP